RRRAPRARFAPRRLGVAPGRSSRGAAEAAFTPLRVLPAAGQAGTRAARSGGALSSGQRRRARAPELDGRLLRAGHGALRRADGELRLLARRAREESRALFPRAFHRCVARDREARARGAGARGGAKRRGLSGRLSENVMHFARLLRAAGLRIGPDRVVDCVNALQIAGAKRRDDWYWTMSAVLLSRQEQRPIFDQAFQIFWRDPKMAERMMQLLVPKAHGRAAKPEEQQSQRLTDALYNRNRDEASREQKMDLEARLTF